MPTQTSRKPTKTAEGKNGNRGRASKPEMDYSRLAGRATAEAEPLTVQRQKQANPFLADIEKSVESGKAYTFGPLPNERAAKQVVSLLSRGAQLLDYGMSTRIGDAGNGQFKVTFQAKPERTKRPRKPENE